MTVTVYLEGAPRWYEVHWQQAGRKRRSRGCTDPHCPPEWHRCPATSTGFAAASLWASCGGPLGQWQRIVLELGWVLGRDLEEQAGPQNLRGLLVELSSTMRADGVPCHKSRILDRNKPPAPLPIVELWDPEITLKQLWKIPEDKIAAPELTLAVREQRIKQFFDGAVPFGMS
jgi:hypothetical protein